MIKGIRFLLLSILLLLIILHFNRVIASLLLRRLSIPSIGHIISTVKRGLTLQILLNTFHLRNIQTKVSIDMVSSTMEFMLPPLGSIKVNIHSSTIDWVRVPIHRDWLLILQKTIKEMTIEDTNRNRLGSASTTKLGTLGEN